jgi:hypothetical protein
MNKRGLKRLRKLHREQSSPFFRPAAVGIALNANPNDGLRKAARLGKPKMNDDAENDQAKAA